MSRLATAPTTDDQGNCNRGGVTGAVGVGVGARGSNRQARGAVRKARTRGVPRLVTAHEDLLVLRAK